MGQTQIKEKTEGATGLGRLTTEQIERCYQMTALRFQTGEEIPDRGRDTRTARPPFGPKEWGSLREDFESIIK